MKTARLSASHPSYFKAWPASQAGAAVSPGSSWHRQPQWGCCAAPLSYQPRRVGIWRPVCHPQAGSSDQGLMPQLPEKERMLGSWLLEIAGAFTREAEPGASQGLLLRHGPPPWHRCTEPCHRSWAQSPTRTASLQHRIGWKMVPQAKEGACALSVSH